MGRVSSNSFGLAAVREATLNTPAATGWVQLEPNGSPTIQAEITTVARNPISPDRQRKKGTISDLSASATFDHDLTMEVADTFLPGFLFANATNADLDFFVSAVAVTGANTVPALNASQVQRMPFNAKFASLFFGAGFGNLDNNGLWKLKNAAANAGTDITLERVIAGDSDPVAEAAATGRLFRAGVALNGGSSGAGRTTKAGVYDGGTRRYTLTTADGPNWTQLGLTAGEMVSLDGHFGRVVSTTATTLVLDQVDTGMQTFSPGDEDEVLVLFGKFIRNVSLGDSDYQDVIYHIEGAYPGLGAANETEYKYAAGCTPSQITINVPLGNKVTSNFAFVATDVEPPTAVRKAGAGAARKVDRGTAYSSTSDVARLRITELDEDGLTTFFKNLTITINNNVTEEKVIGKLGAEFTNAGDLNVDIETTILFTNGQVLTAIRNNETTSFQIVLQNDNGAIVFDVPAMTIGGGAEDLPENQAVTINLTGRAFPHPVFNTSLGISIHPYRKAA